MQNPSPLHVHASALFSRERKRRRLEAFLSAFDRDARPLIAMMLPSEPMALKVDLDPRGSGEPGRNR